MKVGIFGSGYVGLVTGICLADIGHHVTCIDLHKEKVDNLKKGKVPFYEPGLEMLLKKNQEQGKLNFSLNPEDGCAECDVIIIAVGTPTKEGGNGADISCVLKVIESISGFLKSSWDHSEEKKDGRFKIIIVKSTVPMNTGDLIDSYLKDKGIKGVEIVSNPEFLRESFALDDFYCPDRIVVGSNALQKIQPVLQELYAYFFEKNVPCVWTTRQDAELIKYASNVFLATKVAFINELSHLCDFYKGNISSVAYGIGLDQRIAPSFLNAGPGIGGSCLPKDTRALAHMAQEAREKTCFSFPLITSCVKSNEEHMAYVSRKAVDIFSFHKNNIKGAFKEITRERNPQGALDELLGNKKAWVEQDFQGKVAIAGLAFKKGTDDVRESPSLRVIGDLRKALPQVTLAVYDPKVTEQTHGFSIKEDVYWSVSLEDLITDSDLLIMMTDGPEFKEISWDMFKEKARQPVIFDTRNLLDERSQGALFKSLGITCYGLGKSWI